jgi:dipeptidyl aminopeptidase/acylaminoacyl peptidase
MARPFINAGFVVLVPVLRGENGQPGDFTLFYDEVDDVLAAADFLAKQPGVDPDHLYVAGHSAGGTLAMLAAMASKRFRAAASFSGAVHQSHQDPSLLVFDRSDRREFRLRSPLFYHASFQCPVRIYYGDREDWAKGDSQFTALQAKGKGLDVEAVEVPGDHYGSVPEARRRAIAFFRQKM